MLQGHPNISQVRLFLSPSPRSKSYDVLEPYEVIRYLDEGSNRRVVLRELLRRDLLEHANHCRPNELVYTDHFDVVPSDEVRRACLVRFYPESDVVKGLIPSPYNQDGTGSAFYITKRLVRANGVLELLPIHESLPRSLIQGFDPCEISSKATLRGLDLFSGWGSFGRGLEEGGVLKNRWAVDLYDAAIHAYHANLRDPDETKLFFGSVNDMLHQAMSANPKSSTLIPARGEVDFISAGSPCQGFSQLNNRKHDEKSLRNQSLVASVAAFVDFYRPKYGILENVVSISNQNRDQDVLSQLICSLVGMGYQVQEPFLLEAWNHGSAQSRSRLFICFAAPGLEPMVQPEQSHSHHPQQAGKSRAIGKLANGAAFGERHHGPTPFRYLTARNVCADLPATDGACMHIRHPDHVPARVLTERHRQQIAVIPKRPRGMTFIKAWDEGNGVMTSAERSLFPASGANKEIRGMHRQTFKSLGSYPP